MNRLQEIEQRKLEIRGILESGAECDLEALERELRDLDTEKAQIEKRAQIAASINAGNVQATPVAQPIVPEVRTFEGMTKEEILESPEYRTGYLKQLQGKVLTDAEKRAVTTGASSAGAAVPTTTLNKIVEKLQQTTALFPMINVSYIPGNLNIAVANGKNAATWKAEGVDGTAQDDTVTNISLSGYELIKIVEISAAADAMTIDAFEAYIATEIGKQLAIAIESAIFNGDGTGEPTGILAGITWGASNSTTWPLAGTLGYDNLMDALALLPTMYHKGACFCMNRKMLYGGVRKIKDDLKQPIFTYNPQDAAAMSILGYPITLSDYVPDDTVVLCDPSYYYMNFSKSPEISASREAAFKSGKIAYRGLLVADGKPALAEAFVKISKATS